MPDPRSNPVDVPVLDAIRRRWSPVGFDGEPVERESLLRILEAARWAASTFNEQPWRFVVASRREEELFRRLGDVLVPANQEWASHAGALMLVCTKKTYTRNGKPNRYAWFDAGQALAHLFLQTIDEGLHGHAMAGFDAEKARADFAIPDDFEPVCVLAIGRHAQGAHLSEDTAARDRGPRERRPLSELVFGDRFGEDSPLLGD